MKSRLPVWLFLAGLAATTAWAAPRPGRTAHIDDTTQLLPQIPGDLEALEAKLADFEHRSGIKLLVQFHDHSPSPDEDKVPGAYMRSLASREGTLQHGILVVYFAEDSDWRVWIGDELIPRFTGKPGTAKQQTANGAIHDMKEGLLNLAREKSETAITELQKSLPGDEVPSTSDKIRLQLGTMLDVLITRFSGKL
jgi:hypothetical protein